jgi:hypothetical protein
MYKKILKEEDYKFVVKRNIDGKIFYFAAPSHRLNKKYDAYDENKEYHLSFGQLPYQHYNDRLGYYDRLNHNNQKRRENYLNRFGNYKRFSAEHFSTVLLW